MATSLIALLRHEMMRLARKVTKPQMSTLQSASAAHRRSIAALRRDIAALEREVKQLRRTIPQAMRVQEPSSAEENGRGFRFQAKGLKSHRQRTGLSAADYGRLIGVSSLTVYNWESGKTKPRRSQLPAIAAARTIGKREAKGRLKSLETD